VTLRARIWTLLLIAAGVVLVTALVLRGGAANVSRSADTIATQYQPASDYVASLNTALAEMDSAVTSYALTGDISDVGTYIEASARVETEFARLRGLLEADAELSLRLDEAQRAVRFWKQQGVRPIIAATRGGERPTARGVVRSGVSRNLYNDVRSSTRALDREIRQRVDSAVLAQEEQSLSLLRLLNITTVINLALISAIALMLFTGVLRPLRRLQDQMLRVAQEGLHEKPIAPSGPPELRAVGQDAEKMRRELVTEIDRSRMADEGLEQKTPLVAAIRGELSDHHEVRLPGLDLYGLQQPAEGVMAGDWWGAQILPGGFLAVTVTDVSGHGTDAVMEALRLKHAVEFSLEKRADPARALRTGAQGFKTSRRFATCLVVVIDPRTGRLTWANAGHPPGWLIEGDVRQELEPTGPLLSVLEGEWTNRRTRMPPGSMLLAWTDGLTESRDADGHELGDERLWRLLRMATASETTARGVVDHVLSAARSRSVQWRRDDVTCLAVRRTADAQPV
jgi:serine phosphatase RsbU (regulator of sigma subunit)/CHASE3 domain sensor protein